jgi:hypothetical protein
VKKFLVALIVLALACGKRGDPKPPVPVIPAAINDLVVTQRADKVLLSWSYPSLTTAGRSLTDIRRITVYRYVEDLPVTPAGVELAVDSTEPRPIALFSKVPTIPKAQFVKLSSKVDSIEKANLGSATAGARLLFTDSPPLRTTDGRPVRLIYAVVTEGSSARSEPSNLVTIVPLPVGVPPSNVKTEAKAEGVVVSWAEPAKSVGDQGAPVISGYNIYRTAKDEALNELAVPVNTAPVKGTMYTDVPPYGDHEYRVAAVASTGPPLLQSDPSAPVGVRFKDLVPPPAPASITPLIETNAVRLVWEPVTVPDLAVYRVYRSEGMGHGPEIKEVGTIVIDYNVHDTTYVDRATNLGIAYRYAVTAFDKSGNESPKVWTDWVVAPKTP